MFMIYYKWKTWDTKLLIFKFGYLELCKMRKNNYTFCKNKYNMKRHSK